jgi:hypothetical protein
MLPILFSENMVLCIGVIDMDSKANGMMDV